MNTKHTKGPWHVTEYPGDADVMGGCSIGIDDAFGADGGRNYYLATVVHGDPDELAANARLVAAAPELLAALRALLRAVRKNSPGGEPPTADAIFARAGNAALAAIAKATESAE
jgi:hypothetical protein